MKKRIFWTICAAVMFLCIGCGNEGTAKIMHYGVEAKTVHFEQLEEMEEHSELIIKGERLDDEEALITTVNGKMVSGFTFSKVKITEIYGDKTGEYKVGDEITVLENEVYDEANNTVYHIGGYNMMVAGDEYLLFLHYAQTDEMEYFVSSGVNCGTISLETDERQRVYTTEGGDSVVDYSNFQKLWDEALEKYIN